VSLSFSLRKFGPERGGRKMTEPTTRELYDIINAMRVEIGVMNTKMDFVMDSKKTGERAEQKAERALQRAEDLAKDVEGIKKTAMWAIGLTISSIIAIGGVIVSIAF
jgi:GTP-binding protein EngB required for normal cell division